MPKAKDTAPTTAPERTASARNTYEVFHLLARAGLDRLNVDELTALSGATEIAENEAERLAKVCDGIACLVSNDGQCSPQSGNFQHPDAVFDLLCSVSQGLNTIAALIHVGSEADYLARTMRQAEQA
ncbi:MAG: hypothetical protein KDG52_21745 [Rhodocyclaceae bacterium]|nr:hypothetical protein [Rhodocyclaceae bacterium]